MDGQVGPVDEKIVLGVNWMLDSCDDEEEDQQELPVVEKLVCDVNWAPDSCDEEEEDVQEKLVHATKKMITTAEGDDPDIVHALMQLASTEVTKFQSDKERDDCASNVVWSAVSGRFINKSTYAGAIKTKVRIYYQ
jgi:hypothetical protein